MTDKSPDQLVREICKKFGYSLRELRGPSRASWVVRRRKRVIDELHKFRYSSVEIGQVMWRHHTVILDYLHDRPAALRKK